MKKLLAIGLVLLSPSAFAGLYLEPYLGYEMGDLDGTVSVSSPVTLTVETKSDLKGINFGGKIGWSLGPVILGADVMMGKLETEEDGETTDTDTQDMGVFVRSAIPLLPVQFSGTYFLSSKGEDDDDSEYEGSGFKLGASFTGLPFIAINFDMIMINYDDSTVPGVTVSETDLDRKTYMLSVSLPLDL